MSCVLGLGASAGPGDQEAAPIALDKLLTLPSSQRYTVDRRGGASAAEWKSRFRTTREALDAERERLRKSEEELAEMAGAKSAWAFTAPGMPGATVGETPLDFELREKVKRGRAKVQLLERELRELEVEANLAGVPDDWRE